VFPRDAYGNAVADSTAWFALKIVVSGSETEVILNSDNEFKHKIFIVTSSELTFEMSFLYKGSDVHIENLPLSVKVVSPPLSSRWFRST